jgi:peptidoglycan/LPS O-acetylase OafA/YrhL
MVSPQGRLDVDDIERNDPGRLRSLDGLRGVAALVVVMYHAVTTWTPFALEARRLIPAGPPGTALWWLSATPLSLAVSGGQAVIVFFVLSGIAMTLPVLKRPHFDWWAYYPRRTVRLLLPATASVVLAAIYAYATIGMRVPQANPALNTDLPMTVRWESFIRAIDLTNGELTVNSVLWSLNWEMWFSMALPLFVAFAFLVRGRWALGAAIVSLVVSWLGSQTNSLALAYQAPFFCGALIAGNFSALRAVADSLRRRRLDLVLGALLVALSLSALALGDWAFAWNLPPNRVTGAFTPTGAVLLVLAALFWRPGRFFLETRPLQWLGKISFSLYLVHLPLMSAAIAVFGADHWVRANAVAIPAAFVVAIFFFRFVEKPSHVLSKRVGAFVSAAVGRAEARRHDGPKDEGRSPNEGAPDPEAVPPLHR